MQTTWILFVPIKSARATPVVCVCVCVCVCELQYDHPLVYGFYITVDDKCIGESDDFVDISTLIWHFVK
jgi:hypothetical protein